MPRSSSGYVDAAATRLIEYRGATTMTRKRKPQFPTDEELKEAFRHLVAIGAIIDSGNRGKNGEVMWTLDKTHPYWAQTNIEEIEAKEDAAALRRRGPVQ
jgi:hypothetical protein